jgi:hypothetical protein
MLRQRTDETAGNAWSSGKSEELRRSDVSDAQVIGTNAT